MKKYLLLLLLSAPASATLITHSDYVAGNTITAASQNSNENAIISVVNGNLDATNLADGAVTAAKLASAVQAQFVPSGSVFYWVGSTNSIPTGYLYCNGQAVSRTTYATLFTAIGTAFGSGNGSTTFNVPDMRGYFVRGLSDDSSNDPDKATRTAAASGGNTGNNIGSVQISTVSAHTHTASVTDPGHFHNLLGVNTASGVTPVTLIDTNARGLAAGGPSNATAVDQQNNQGTDWVDTRTTGVTVSNANSGGTETRPINIYMGGIIKY